MLHRKPKIEQHQAFYKQISSLYTKLSKIALSPNKELVKTPSYRKKT